MTKLNAKVKVLSIEHQGPPFLMKLLPLHKIADSGAKDGYTTIDRSMWVNTFAAEMRHHE